MDFKKLEEELEIFLCEFDKQKLEDWIIFDKLRSLSSMLHKNYICKAGRSYLNCHIHSDSIGGCFDCGNFGIER